MESSSKKLSSAKAGDSSKSSSKKSSSSSSKKEKELSKAQAKEQKRKKQEQKAIKKEKKKTSKQKKAGGGGDDDADDDMDDETFEKMVAELMLRDAEHNQVTVDKLPGAPETRASFSLCLAGNNPQDGFVMFGGEFFNGATSKCFDDLLRFRLVSMTQPPTSAVPFGGGEWKRITSPNSPPPRCAHAACTTPTHVFVFGGEFSTAWRFHHYNDLWRLDLKTNQWTAMPSVNGPSPRSGSRMVSWKNFLIVFGGFYEASRGVRWHDDLHLYDLRTEKWSRAKFVSSTQQPSARSGFQFASHPTKPMVFLYGGYSKVAATAAAQKGRAMDDMWILYLNPMQNNFPECRWEFLPKKGTAPGKRSGASSCIHKNRLLLFGGVSDTETQNDVVGEFHNSLYSFDMDRYRWYELQLKAGGGGGRKGRRSGGKKEAGSVSTSATASAAQDEDDQVDDQDEDDDDDDEGESAAKAFGLRDDAFYVIVDGKFVLVEQDDDDEEEGQIASPEEEKKQKQQQPAVASSDTPSSTADHQEKNPKNEEDDEDVTPSSSSTLATPSNKPWNGQPAPEPRISSGMCVLNNRLFIYGGTAERGDVQITFDDMWCLDVNKMDSWIELYQGKWREQEWAGAKDEAEEDEDDDEDDDDSQDSEEEEEEEEDEDDGTDEDELNVRALAEEIKSLRDELGVDQEANTPSPGESMRDFFQRTCKYWIDECAKTRGDERLSGKELRGIAFNMAKRRYELLFPLLEKLNSLQEAQRLAEEEAAEEARQLAEKLARRNAKKAMKKAAAAAAAKKE